MAYGRAAIERLGRSMMARAGVCLLLFYIAFSVRYSDISFRGLWMDEDFQAQSSAFGFFSPKVAKGAYMQSQPPLDYYLQAIGISLFGYNELGIRIHAVLAGALASLLFFVLIRRHYGFFAALLGFILFAFNPWLVRYSVEARPYSTSVLFCVVFLFALYEFAARMSVRSGILFFFAQFIFLCSIGLQPLVLVFCFGMWTVVSLIFFARPFQWKEACKVLAPYAAAFLFYIPVYFILLSRIDTMGRIYPLTTWLQRFPALLERYRTADFMSFLAMAGKALPLVVVAFAAQCVVLFIQRRFSVEKKEKMLRFVLLGVFVFFPVIAWFVWFLLMKNWVFYEKYKLVYLPVLLLAISLGIRDLFLLIKEYVRGRKAGKIIRAAVALVIIVACAACVVGARPASRSLVPHQHCWRELFAALKNDVAQGDVAILLSLTESGLPPHWFGHRAYFNRPDVFLLSTDDSQLYDVLKRIDRFGAKGQKIYFTFYLDGVYDPIIKNDDFLRGPSCKVFDITGLWTVRYSDNSKGLLEKVQFFFEYVARIAPGSQTTARLARQLTEFSLSSGDIGKAVYYLQKLKRDDRKNNFKHFVEEVEQGLSLLALQKMAQQQ